MNMNANTPDSKSIDNDLNKCNQLSQYIALICGQITEMQNIDNRLKLNSDLDSARQLLRPLTTINEISDDKSKIVYLNEYRDHMASGLTKLSVFLKNKSNFKALNGDQLNDVSKIASNLVLSQDYIIQIVNTY